MTAGVLVSMPSITCRRGREISGLGATSEVARALQTAKGSPHYRRGVRRAATAWSALADRPWRFLASAWPWRSFAYVVSSPFVALGVLAALIGAVVAGILLSPVWIGILVLYSLPVLGVGVGRLERWRIRLMQGPDEPPLASPHPALPDTTLRQRIAYRRREPASLRALGYTALLAFLVGWVDFVLVLFTLLPTGVLALSPLIASFQPVSVFWWQADTPAEALPLALLAAPAWFVLSAYVLTLAAAAQAELARSLLGPREEELRERVAELRRSRLDLVDAFETERRRIERHLHDGVQQRLVGLTMTLGLAEYQLPEGEVRELLRKAHAEAESALADLRDAVRDIHPRVLVDHGLPAAVNEVADRLPIPVSVELSLTDRLPQPVEAAAYFVVSEALSNVAKHSQASRCTVRGWVAAGSLVVVVEDDGVGGADPAGGTGLAGLITRVEALSGTLDITSPVGGPTRLRMEVPCQTN
jgi:signal transduction histidine kinase